MCRTNKVVRIGKARHENAIPYKRQKNLRIIDYKDMMEISEE